MKRRWTFLTISLVAVLALFTAACGSDKDDSASTTTAGGASTTAAAGDCKGPSDAYSKETGKAGDFKPVTADTLTVVTSLPGPGFWEGSDSDPTQVKSGFEYDIANSLKEAFGVSKLVVRNESFDAIVAGTVTDYDLALSQISITCERAKVVTFTEPYFESNQGVLIKKGGKQILTLEDAKAAQWGVQTGTTAIDLLSNKVKPTKEPKVFQQLPDTYTALEAGQVDAVLIDTAINLGQAARSEGRLEVVSQFSQDGGPDQYGGILPKDSKNIGAVNAAMKELKSSGKLADLAKKDLTADPGNIPVIKAG